MRLGHLYGRIDGSIGEGASSQTSCNQGSRRTQAQIGLASLLCPQREGRADPQRVVMQLLGRPRWAAEPRLTRHSQD